MISRIVYVWHYLPLIGNHLNRNTFFNWQMEQSICRDAVTCYTGHDRRGIWEPRPFRLRRVVPRARRKT